MTAVAGLDYVWLVGGGVTAGVVSSVVGLASLVSYPMLLALGLPPLQANVTNTVALTFAGVGNALGSRPELAGLGRQVFPLAVASTAGALLGGILLLGAPAETFTAVVPVLILSAGLLLLAEPRLARLRGATATRGDRHSAGWLLALGAAAVYVGYFGAGGGIVMFAILNLSGRWSPVVTNAVKNSLSGFSNAAASVLFVASSVVVWSAALSLGAGFLLGGWVGPAIVRRLEPTLFRGIAVVAAVGLAVKLGVDHYA